MVRVDSMGTLEIKSGIWKWNVFTTEELLRIIHVKVVRPIFYTFHDFQLHITKKEKQLSLIRKHRGNNTNLHALDGEMKNLTIYSTQHTT